MSTDTRSRPTLTTPSCTPATQTGIPTLTLTREREDRPRYVTLVQYVRCYDDLEDQTWVLPVRRTLEWLKRDDGNEYLVCTRVTELKWRDLRPAPAHRELVEAWVSHVRDQVTRGARPVALAVEP